VNGWLLSGCYKVDILLWPDVVRQILQQFPIAPGACQAVDSDGFSGARLWRVMDGDRSYCLRCWPEGASEARVLSINAVLARAKLPFVPRPLIANSRQSVVTDARRHWTLQPWMPGQSISNLPPPRELLREALHALAQFHRSTAGVSFSDERHQVTSGESPEVSLRGAPAGLASRTSLTLNSLQQRLTGLKTAPIAAKHAELAPRRERLVPLFLEVAPRILEESRPALQWSVPLQACIRDIHASHVLFTGGQVTGLIDFDAMRVDNVATDLARLLGSYAGDDFELWEIGLSAYDEIRPLSRDERELVVHYDRLAVLLTGLQWLQWMLLEGKQFELAKALPRIDATLLRLEHLRNGLRTASGLIV